MLLLSRAARLAPLSLAFAVLSALAACGGKGGAAGDSAGASASASAPAAGDGAANASGDLADITAFRLTMERIDKYFVAQKNVMTRAAAMSPAERDAMKARSDARDNNNADLDQMVRNVESEPLLASAIKDAGLSAREYTMILMSMMQSAMAGSVAKSRPNDNQDSLIRAMQANPENVKFFRDNEADIMRRQQELAAEAKRLGLDG